ncbi:CheR family methyltransferase [Hydrocoleum sp. CS-953]|uniref:CheR family methyltransferase n=1 Tax=Hydrocoleum sp. CS-953 TaxID=1671698 RepID=UPI000B9AA17C|nr:CheR family methyltransferase [Hydrocoleum sp. CS-953]
MESTTENQFFIIGIGISTENIQPLEDFFSHLPDQPNATFIIVINESSSTLNQITQLLETKNFILQTIEDGMTINSQVVYVVPWGKKLHLEGRNLFLQELDSESEYPINDFFTSLAQELEWRAIGILISDSNKDGVEGLEAIGKANGLAVMQSLDTNQFIGVCVNSIFSGLVDEMLSPTEVAQLIDDILQLAENSSLLKQDQQLPLVPPQQLEKILKFLHTSQNIDFSHYKTTTISRRVTHRCSLSECDTVEDYINYLENCLEEQASLCQALLIGTTQFFRDPDAWEYLRTEILPELLNHLQEENKELRIWVSACATGEEAYSMAMLIDETMRELGILLNVKIFATDINLQALEIATKGIYPGTIVNDISPERLEEYFNYETGHYQIKRSLREMVIFALHDLTKNPGFSNMSIVLCRNVLIYMQPRLQQQVLRLLHFSLSMPGIMFLGNTETVKELQSEFVTINSHWKLYRKRRDVKLASTALTTRAPVTLPIFNPYKPQRISRSRLDVVLANVFEFGFGERKISCVLVNQDNRLINVFYNSANLLTIPIGPINLEISDVVPAELRLPISTALHRIKRELQTVLYSGIRLHRNNEVESITLRVGYTQQSSTIDKYFIIFMEVMEVEKPSQVALENNDHPNKFPGVGAELAEQIIELEYELQQTRDNLQAAVEELGTINEEQQVTNEDLMAANEELQSTNEELQSTNEEIFTMNAQYQAKIEELTRMGDDLDNLFRSIDIGVVFLDQNLKIRLFTPVTTQAINIRNSDIDRPLSHFTHNLDCPDLMEILEQVIQTQQPIEKEVTLSTTGHHILMRVHPYLRENGESDGLVIVLIDIHQLQQTQNQLTTINNLLETLYESSPMGLFVLDQKFKILRFNPALADINNLPRAEYLGRNISEILPEFTNSLTPLWRQVLETGEVLRNIQVNIPYSNDPDSEGWWLGTYYPVELENDKQAIGGIITDITQLQETQQKLLASQRFIQRITDSHPGIIRIFNLEEQSITYINGSVTQLLGYTPDEILAFGGNIIPNLIHPDDVERIQNHYHNFPNLAEQETIEIEYRLCHKNQQCVWFFSREVVFKRSSTGKIVEVLGVDIDISDSRRVMQNLE